MTTVDYGERYMVSERRLDEVINKLLELKRLNADPNSGRIFTYIELGDPELRQVVLRAFEEFLYTNALIPLIYGSALFFEKEVVSFSKKLVHASEDVVGTVTYGGTESNMLAVRAARGLYRMRHGAHPAPRVVAPVTVHPSVKKAADYLGLRVTLTPVDPETKKADPEAVKRELKDDVALVVLSAPNYPFGTIDPVRDIAEAAMDKGIPVHVDACIGGFVLPFMERLGLRVELFDFRVEGVSSISMDLHKYGYSPKGASVILFRNPQAKKESLYIDLEWPGYPLANTTVLSSRTVAPLAAAWAVVRYLGIEGYTEKTGLVVKARDEILDGLKKLGFSPLAPVESPVVSLSLEPEEDLFRFHANMSRRGWVIGLQPRFRDLAPFNIHLNIAPVHIHVVNEFLRDAGEALREPIPEEVLKARELLEKNPMALVDMIGRTPYDSILIAWLLSAMSPETAWEAARELVVELYRA